VSEDKPEYTVERDMLEPAEGENDGAEREQPVCPRCGGPHLSYFACPAVPASKKRQAQRAGGFAKVAAAVASRRPSFKTRASTIRFLEALAVDTAKLKNSTGRATTLLALTREIERLKRDLWDEGEAELLEQAAAILKREKERREQAK